MSNQTTDRPLQRSLARSTPFRPTTQLNGLIAAMRSTVGRWLARSRQRRALREIAERNDFHLLKDIGVSQEEALREADKPFWRR